MKWIRNKLPLMTGLSCLYHKTSGFGRPLTAHSNFTSPVSCILYMAGVLLNSIGTEKSDENYK